jgi:argininosuccinate lyase
MKKLWQTKNKLNQSVEAFETRGDLLVDQNLVKYDVLGSLAQVKMLHKIGILSIKELSLKKD